MNEFLRIDALGSLHIQIGNKPAAGFISRKVEALLVYLAYSKGEHSREKLAELLWTLYTPERANANLRTAISNLQQVVGPYLQITPHSLSLNPDCDYWLDALQLSEMLHIARASADQHDSISSETARHLESALALYQGDFLAGFYLKSSAGFEGWMLEQQEALRGEVMDAMSMLLDYYVETRAYHLGIPMGKRLLALDPFDETHLQKLMYLLALSGSRNAALRQYHESYSQLMEELGEAPSRMTTALYEQIRDETFAEQYTSDVPNNLPAMHTACLGRFAELTCLSQMLGSTQHRVIAITGLPGVGKTHLAVQLAYHHLDRFPDGVFLIQLDGITCSADAFAVLSASMDARIKVGERLRANMFGSKRMLLILDGLETVTEKAELIRDVLAAGPEIRVLVTAQMPIKLAAGSIRLEPLGVPLSHDDAELLAHPSVQLFQQTARRIKPDFSLSTERGAVIQICRLVGGHPLALKLAAGLLRIMTAAQIARQLEDNLNLLETANRDTTPRQRQMVASLDYGWNLLSTDEQETLAHLANPEAGFVPHPRWVSYETLPRLLEKHWLHEDEAGQLSLHPIVWLYLRHKRQAGLTVGVVEAQNSWTLPVIPCEV